MKMNSTQRYKIAAAASNAIDDLALLAAYVRGSPHAAAVNGVIGCTELLASASKRIGYIRGELLKERKKQGLR